MEKLNKKARRLAEYAAWAKESRELDKKIAEVDLLLSEADSKIESREDFDAKEYVALHEKRAKLLLAKSEADRNMADFELWALSQD